MSLPHHTIAGSFDSLRVPGSANPAAAKHNVTAVNDCSLSGRYGTLRVMQSDMCSIVLERRHCRTRPAMVISDFHVRCEAQGGRSSCDAGLAGVRPSISTSRDIARQGMPIHTIDLELLADQIAGIANDDAICRRIEVDDITRTRETARQPFALTDREQLDPVMFADKIPVNVINVAAVKFVFAQMGTQKRLVIVPGNKTNFLAVDLVGDLEA